MAYVIGCNGETSRYRPDAAGGGGEGRKERGGIAALVGNVPLFVRRFFFFHRPVAIKSMHIDDIISIQG